MAPKYGKRAAKRESGLDGTIRRLPSGNWVAQWPARIDPDRRNIHYPEKTTYPPLFDEQGRELVDAEGVNLGYRKAQRALRLKIDDYSRGFVKFAEPEDEHDDEDQVVRTVAVVADEFLNAMREDLSGNTLRGYRSDANLLCDVRVGIGERPVAELTSRELAIWRNGLAGAQRYDPPGSADARGLGPRLRPKTAKSDKVTDHMADGVWRFLSSVLSWEAEAGRIPSNPAAGVTVRRRTKKRVGKQKSAERVVVPTWAQLMDLTMSIPTESERLLALVLMWAGPRFSEAASIKADSERFTDDSKILVSEQWVLTKEGWGVEDLKDGEDRDLLLPSELWEAVVDYRDNRRPTVTEPQKPVLFPYVPAGGYKTGDSQGIGVWTATDWRDEVWVFASILAGMVTTEPGSPEPLLEPKPANAKRPRNWSPKVLYQDPKTKAKWLAAVDALEGASDEDRDAWRARIEDRFHGYPAQTVLSLNETQSSTRADLLREISRVPDPARRQALRAAVIDVFDGKPPTEKLKLLLPTKKVRMAAASIWAACGYTHDEIQVLLGHAPGSAVTKRNYVRTQQDRFHPQREAVRMDASLSPEARTDALWEIWLEESGCDPLLFP